MKNIFLTGVAALATLGAVMSPAPVQAAEDLFFKSDSAYSDVIVSKVLSADTIELESGERIRLIGLKAPEVLKKRELDERDKFGFVIEQQISPVNSIEERALDFARHLLEGQSVRLEFDSRKKNDQFITLAYVFLNSNGTFVNAEILKQGYASLRIEVPNTKYKNALREAYQEARREKRGLQSN